LKGDSTGATSRTACSSSPTSSGPNPSAHPVPLRDAIDLGGTIRAAPVATTLAKARSVIRAVGITRIANVTGLDHVGIPTWQVVRPLARSLTVSQGKGLSDSLAQASGIMESIELHHAEFLTPRGHWRSLGDAARDDRYATPLLLPVHPDRDVRSQLSKSSSNRRDRRVAHNASSNGLDGSSATPSS